MCNLLQVPSSTRSPPHLPAHWHLHWRCLFGPSLNGQRWGPTRWAKHMELGGFPARKGCYCYRKMKLFTSNFIRHIYQNLISHDLSSIHISIHGTWPRKSLLPWSLCKAVSTLSICSTGPLHRREQTWTWRVGRVSNCQPLNPAIRPPLEERLPFCPKETPIKEKGGTQKTSKTKILHHSPMGRPYLIWFQKEHCCFGRWPDVFLIYADSPTGDSHLLMHQQCGVLFKSNAWAGRLPCFNPLVRVVRPEPSRPESILSHFAHWISKVRSQQTQTSKLVLL